MEDVRRRIQLGAERVGVTVEEEQLGQLTEYMELLTRWNQRMNLTALDDPDAAVDRLIVEPLVAARLIDSGARILVDVGSGGGSPAVPLKIARPELSLTMVEVRTRKSVFLREVSRHLGLSRVSVETARFEEVLSDPRVAGTVDVISVRAVRAEAEQLRIFGHALKPGGQQLWFLSGAQTVPPMDAPLRVEAEVELVPWRQSRLVVARKSSPL